MQLPVVFMSDKSNVIYAQVVHVLLVQLYAFIQDLDLIIVLHVIQLREVRGSALNAYITDYT